MTAMHSRAQSSPTSMIQRRRGATAAPDDSAPRADSASSGWSSAITGFIRSFFTSGRSSLPRPMRQHEARAPSVDLRRRAMCGLVGIFDTRGRREVSRELVSRMNEAQRHRGPDEVGLHVEPGLGLGHKRLSIIDLSTGQQPLYNEDRSVVIVYNGEIYNYRELIPELTRLGHVFRTKSDTEVIVHGWEQWGEDCVRRFRGMFAFALWDRNRETLFLARDRLGVKPLYYALLGDGTLVFGSELKALMVHPGFKREIEPAAVEDYLAYGYVPEPNTIFGQAMKLPPGYTLSIRRGGGLPKPREYWDLTFKPGTPLSPLAVQEELIERLRDAV